MSAPDAADLLRAASTLWADGYRKRAADELEALRGVVGGVLCNAMNFPENVQARLLGQDMGPLIDRTAEKILAAGYRKNSGVVALTAQLQAAQAKLSAVRSIGARSGTDLNAWNKAFDVLDTTDTSALAKRDAEKWDEGHEQGYDSGRYAESDDEPETVETRSLEKNPYRDSAGRTEADHD